MCQEQWSVETETSSWSQVCVCIGLHWNYQHLLPYCIEYLLYSQVFNWFQHQCNCSIVWHFENAYCPADAAIQDPPSLGLTGGLVVALHTISGVLECSEREIIIIMFNFFVVNTTTNNKINNNNCYYYCYYYYNFVRCQHLVPAT